MYLVLLRVQEDGYLIKFTNAIFDPEIELYVSTSAGTDPILLSVCLSATCRLWIEFLSFRVFVVMSELMVHLSLCGYSGASFSSQRFLPSRRLFQCTIA